MKGSLALLICVVLSTVASPSAVIGEEERGTDLDRFLKLRDRRMVLEVEIPKLRSELQGLRFRQREIRSLELDLEGYRRSLDSAKQERPQDPRKVAFFDEQVKRTDDRLKRATVEHPAGVDQEIKRKEEELRIKEEERSVVENRLNEMLNIDLARQRFKQLMSLFYASAVALLIVGFFLVAGRDEVVRRTIFSGQAGIQFVTLFALVIAIILFGITGILEGKELAALLGGLSGYILGRATFERPGQQGQVGGGGQAGAQQPTGGQTNGA